MGKAIAEKSAVVGVIGLGYVGLPLIQAFTRAGFRCMGFDVDQAKVDALSAGRSYIKHIPSKTIADWIEEARKAMQEAEAKIKQARAPAAPAQPEGAEPGVKEPVPA